jgi:hypothetical protein
MQTIEDLEENRIVNVSVRVLLIGPTRYVNTPHFKGSVRALAVEDDSAKCGLVFWGEDKIMIGDAIIIENGWCKIKDGEKVISAGRQGKIVKIKVI